MSNNKLIESFLEYEEYRNSKTQETNPFNDAYELEEATTFRTKRSSGNEAVIKGKKWGITNRGITVGRNGSSPEEARRALLRDASRTRSGIGSVEATRLRALAQRQKARSSGSSSGSKAAQVKQVPKAKTPNLQGSGQTPASGYNPSEAPKIKSKNYTGSGQTPASGYVGPSAGIKVDTTDNARANATQNALSDMKPPKTAKKVSPNKFSNAGKNEYSEFGTGAYEAAKKRKDDAEAAALTTQNVSFNRNTGFDGAQVAAGKEIAKRRPLQPTAAQRSRANASPGAFVGADGTVYKNEADFNAAQQEKETRDEIRGKAKQRNLKPTITTPKNLNSIPQATPQQQELIRKDQASGQQTMTAAQREAVGKLSKLGLTTNDPSDPNAVKALQRRGSRDSDIKYGYAPNVKDASGGVETAKSVQLQQKLADAREGSRGMYIGRPAGQEAIGQQNQSATDQEDAARKMVKSRADQLTKQQQKPQQDQSAKDQEKWGRQNVTDKAKQAAQLDRLASAVKQEKSEGKSKVKSAFERALELQKLYGTGATSTTKAATVTPTSQSRAQAELDARIRAAGISKDITPASIDGLSSTITDKEKAKIDQYIRQGRPRADAIAKATRRSRQK